MKKKIKNIMYATPFAVASFFSSCEKKELNELKVQHEFAKEIIPKDSVANLKFDSIMSNEDYFGAFGASKFQTTYNMDTFGVMSRNGWKFIFDKKDYDGGEIMSGDVNKIYSSLDEFEKFHSQPITDSLKKKVHIYVSPSLFEDLRPKAGLFRPFITNKSVQTEIGSKKVKGLEGVFSIFYPDEEVITHELFHALDMLFVNTWKERSEKELYIEKLWDNAVENKIWEGTYASTNILEYFAECGRYFSFHKDFLKEKDPLAFEYFKNLEEKFGYESLEIESNSLRKTKGQEFIFYPCNFKTK